MEGVMLRSFVGPVMADVSALDITPEKRPGIAPDIAASFCKPLFAR